MKLMSFAAYGGVYVAKGSATSTGLLGYSDGRFDTGHKAGLMPGVILHVEGILCK